MNQTRRFHCTIDAAMCFIGGKYKPIILWHLMDGPKRFNELQKFIPRATPRMLTMQLRELEADGLINREVFPVVPPKTEYSFTELGSTLIPLIKEIREWGVYYFEATGQKNPCDEIGDMNFSQETHDS
ncbi:MAG: helix-turn-helix transcriptional regulator [Dethiobacter sp.]|nr:helix-turn-helix transcriptional regulator [Dethiobacter sp.]